MAGRGFSGGDFSNEGRGCSSGGGCSRGSRDCSSRVDCSREGRGCSHGWEDLNGKRQGYNVEWGCLSWLL